MTFGASVTRLSALSRYAVAAKLCQAIQALRARAIQIQIPNVGVMRMPVPINANATNASSSTVKQLICVLLIVKMISKPVGLATTALPADPIPFATAGSLTAAVEPAAETGDPGQDDHVHLFLLFLNTLPFGSACGDSFRATRVIQRGAAL